LPPRAAKHLNLLVLLALLAAVVTVSLSATAQDPPVLDPQTQGPPSPDILTPEERAWLTAHDGKIRLAADPDYPPICFRDEDGQFKGVAMDYVRLLEERLGFSFYTRYQGDWDTMMKKARDRFIDVIPDIQPTPERTDFFQFTDPYITIPNLIITRDHVERTLTVDKLKGMKVAVVESYATHEYALAHPAKLDLMLVKDSAAGLQAVSMGRADAMIVDLAVASYTIESLGLNNLQVSGEVPEVTWTLTFGSRNDWPLLGSILAKGLSTITAEEAKAIRNRWLPLGQAAPSLWANWRTYALVGWLVFLGWVVVIVWTSALRRLVAERTDALNLSEERMALALEAAQDGIWDWDVVTGEVYYSPRYAGMLGYDTTEVPGHVESWLDLIHPEDRDRAYAANQACIEGRQTSFRCQFRMLHRNNSWRWIEGKGKAVSRGPDGQATRMVGTHTDITDLKNAEEEKLGLERRVQSVQKLESLGILAGGIAHDFNNLLMAILGNADLALMDLPDNSPARASVLEIDKASRRAADLARQMLAYSGRGQFVIEPLNLNDLIREMVELLEVSIGRNARLVYELTEDLPWVPGDATQIRQIVMNLITNGSEALGDEPGTLTMRTGRRHCSEEDLAALSQAVPGHVQEDLEPGEFLFFEVSDSGCGMDSSTLTRIFEPFFTTKFTGRGLGMSAVMGIVKGHHGIITVASQVGRGTTFTVYLPLDSEAQSSGSAEPLPTVHLPRVRVAAEGIILLIDDDEAVLEVTRRMLVNTGYTVLAANDGELGVEMFAAQQDSIDYCLVDLTMPGLDGREVFRELRRMDPQVKVLLCSGFTSREAPEDFAWDPHAGFLQKPFTTEDLQDKLAELGP
jgi:PAS domain S-box-containing protein